MLPGPAYTSPEQIDGRTDIYSLGAVGYFLLTGQPPYPAQRFATASELDAALAACAAASSRDPAGATPQGVRIPPPDGVGMPPFLRPACVVASPRIRKRAPKDYSRMRYRRQVLTAGAAIVLLGAGGGVRAKTPLRAAFFNVYPSAAGSALDSLPSNDSHCGVCHYNFNGGGAVNAYAEDVHVAVHSGQFATYEAAIRSVEFLDSDGDGFTNIVEVTDITSFTNTPTFPGLAAGSEGLLSNVNPTEVSPHLTPAALPVRRTTWGRIKALYFLN
ncbi:MAG TPA: hypothetical protein VFT13_04895 [Candidatus Krumholzibacteria bacterium]|nr:hypothetical protein [Candidatus Krumholzibacteria bacterium]